MIRKYINRLEKSGKDNITWRSNEPMRIEAFSDGVFAFAVSLSVISLEVPHSFNELLDMMRGFLPFVLCYSGLFMVWLSQHKFFRRYGMKDEVTVALNAILLLMVLFFIYPLKFLFSSLYLPDKYIMKKDEFNSVFIMYGSGVAVIYLLFTMMYINAWLKRRELKLRSPELFETETYIFNYAGRFGTVFVTVLMLHATSNMPQKYATASFVGMFGLMTVFNYINRRRKALFKKRFGNIPEPEPARGPE